MSEAEFDVDAAEAEFDAAKAAREAGEEGEQAAAGAEDDAAGDGGEREDPPTYMTHAEWVAAGRDPEDYIGKKAFQKRHDDIQDNKKLRRELKTIGQTQKQTMEAVQEWQSTERARVKAELEAELHTAKEAEDVNAAIEAQQKLDNLEADPAPAAVPEHQVIQDFREDNPKLDRDSDDFDDEFTVDVEIFYNDRAQRLSRNGKRKLSDAQITRCLKQAMKEANELHEIEDEPAPGAEGDEGGRESPRNKRPTGKQRSTRRPRNKAADAPKAEDYDLKDRLTHNPRDGNAATEIRETIRQAAEDNARKNGKDDAAIKKEGDEAATNFERSIA